MYVVFTLCSCEASLLPARSSRAFADNNLCSRSCIRASCSSMSTLSWSWDSHMCRCVWNQCRYARPQAQARTCTSKTQETQVRGKRGLFSIPRGLHTALYLLRSYCLQLSLHMIQVGLQRLQPTGTNNQRVCESSHASVHLHIMRCIYCYHSHSSVQAHRLEIGLMFASVLCVYFMCACGPVGMCTQRLACESASCLRCWCVSSLRRCVSWFCRRSCDRKFSYVFCW